MNEKEYEALLDLMLSKQSAAFDDLAWGRMGLIRHIHEMERPYADQNSQADIEGRPRPVRSYGGIQRGDWWK